ncbi:hypothetical protein PJP10_32070, partial [Mycobacterium kansasii]
MNVATTKTNLSLPFGRLICKMAKDCGFGFILTAPLESQNFIDENTIKRMKLIRQEDVERGEESN